MGKWMYRDELQLAEINVPRAALQFARAIAYPDLSVSAYMAEFHELSDEERNAFMSDVAKVGKAITAAFSPAKINYGAYADTISHLHMHVVPKYNDGYGFGGVFEMNPQKVILSDAEYAELIEKIKVAL